MNHFEFGFFDELEKIAAAVDPSLGQVRQRYSSPRHTRVLNAVKQVGMTPGGGKMSRADMGASIHHAGQLMDPRRGGLGSAAQSAGHLQDIAGRSMTFPQRHAMGMRAYGL